ncbi:YSC84-related protein [Flavobacterium sinopsychrotolerans]|jgi:lipid-binding SYLF domain-containing protein|uniref:Lipid-binding SYLF domain-containing protein n=2 Tax=Flavobacterium TaxID=237 RepID=A0A495S1X9_9FLAO|nr:MULTISPECIES: YSC84-related protein [Flavobacterium]RKS93807.1 lipid-binding SYLF domain-containing protein [Flavobacterium limicola]SEO24175.1 Lipid-binding SYLF domain-containing protein [Flavobacterium sinopsychrotolerans]
MKNLNNIWVIVLACLLSIAPMYGQSTAKKNKIIADSQTAKAEFIKSDPLMKALFDKAYGYVIFPNVGKGGLGIGGAAGNGVAYEQNKRVGMAKLSQVSIGFQAGGQAYREVIFFETKNEMDRFKESRFEFSAQASAVAVTEGASANVKYTDGVMVFTMQKGGLMYEASVGGQKFKFNKL